MDIKVIGAFRFALVDAVNMLARLGCKGYALPSIADLETVTLRLESPSPFDVVASILADNDYMSHKQMYMMAFGRVLDCEAFTGDVEADGEVYHYWEGLTAKLDDAPDIDKDLYLAQVERLSGLVQENIRGMKASLTATFGGIDTKPEPQQIEQNKLQKKRGRPTEPFTSKMIDDANGDKLKKMHKVLAGKKGKDFALLIWACIKKGLCNKPTYTQAKEEFGDIGEKTGYNRYLNNNNMFTQEEKEGALKSLE